jgi:xanthine/CO dehydrogenase XdhC/CoxF family maturation factor
MTAQSSQAEVLFEPILPQIALRICGSGPDALALAQAAKALGWIVDVAGDRLWRSESRLALGSDGSDGSDPSDDHPIDCRTAVVIMTHNYARDLEWLRVAHGSPAFYVGLLGPKHRTLRLVNELEVEYGVLGDGAIARMYGPAGLDIGAETPEEIALSIVAEIQAAANGRDGGPLRARAASIHSV